MPAVAKVSLGIGIACAGFVLWLTLGSWFTTPEGYRTVVTRLGAVTEVYAPGFHWKAPFLDDAYDISIQPQKTLIEKMETYSRDQQTAFLRVSVNWHVVEAKVKEMYSGYGSLSTVQSVLLTPKIYEHVKTVFGGFNAETAIQSRGKLNVDTTTALSRAVGDVIQIESVQIEDIAFNDSYIKSIDERMQAEVEVGKLAQNAAREKYQADIALTQAGAKAGAAKLNAEATAYAAKIQGEAEAGSIRARGAALADNPLLVEWAKAEKWDGKLPLTMVPGQAVPFVNVK